MVLFLFVISILHYSKDVKILCFQQSSPTWIHGSPAINNPFVPLQAVRQVQSGAQEKSKDIQQTDIQTQPVVSERHKVILSYYFLSYFFVLYIFLLLLFYLIMVKSSIP